VGAGSLVDDAMAVELGSKGPLPISTLRVVSIFDTKFDQYIIYFKFMFVLFRILNKTNGQS
jgi:hypothetical protein